MRQSTLQDFEPVYEPDVWVCPNCNDDAYESYESVARHHLYCADHDKHFLHDYFGRRLAVEYLNGTSRNDLAEQLNVDRETASDALRSLGVEIRSSAEATALWFSQADEEEIETIAHSGQELAAEALREWRAENADEHIQNARENLPEPKNGPDNWCWKGGKSLRDNLALTYGEQSWANIRENVRENYDRECELCGGSPDSNRRLDVHHIVPLLAGGSNHPDNLIPLCPTCHQKVESYTWDIDEVSPVFD